MKILLLDSQVLRLGLLCLALNFTLGMTKSLYAAEPTITVQDSFNSASGKNDATVPLAGRKVEKGQGVWSTMGNLVVTAKGNVTAATVDSHLASVPLGDPTGILTVRATINPKGSEWIGVAFMDKGNLTDFWKDAKIWVYCRPTGQYEIRGYNTEDVILGTGTASDWNKGEANTVELTYDPSESTVSVKVNGTSILDKTKIDYHPKIHYACFHLLYVADANVPTVADFSVSETSTP